MTDIPPDKIERAADVLRRQHYPEVADFLEESARRAASEDNDFGIDHSTVIPENYENE